jgi:hypothetical protein
LAEIPVQANIWSKANVCEDKLRRMYGSSVWASWPDRRAGHSGNPTEGEIMGERQGPNWRLIERIVIIVEMVMEMEILDRIRLP